MVQVVKCSHVPQKRSVHFSPAWWTDALKPNSDSCCTVLYNIIIYPPNKRLRKITQRLQYNRFIFTGKGRAPGASRRYADRPTENQMEQFRQVPLLPSVHTVLLLLSGLARLLHSQTWTAGQSCERDSFKHHVCTGHQ